MNSAEKIERIFTGSSSVGLVFTDAELVDEKATPLGEGLWDYTFPKRERTAVISGEFYRSILRANMVTGATAAFRSSFVGDFLPIPTHIPNFIHDAWIALVISVSAEIGFIQEPLIQYRQHSAQQLGVNWNMEMNGSMRERFSKAKEIRARQLVSLEMIKPCLKGFPALARGKKIEGVLSEVERDIKEQVIHLENRLALLDKTFGRIPLILTELTSGRYRRFSKGLMSAFKDLVAR